MGEVELRSDKDQLIIHSVLIFYGDAANDVLSWQIARDVANHWNEPNAKVQVKKKGYHVQFDIRGKWDKLLTPLMVYENTDPLNNYFRIEEYATGNISFVDAINSNTGYFKLENLLSNSTTAAHEYGHTIGLDHPANLDIRGKGIPGIMYPRGTLVDPQFQYDPDIFPGQKGGTLNPFTRKVLQVDINNLHLENCSFNRENFAVLGDFTSQWHEKHLP
jgi:hypothetical protein